MFVAKLDEAGQNTMSSPILQGALRLFAIAALMLLPTTASPVQAVERALPKPSGEVLLTVTGEMTERNLEDGSSFDRHMLESLGTVEMRTTTPWTDGVGVFRGVLMSDLLDRVGASGEVAHALALNDYEVVIPTEDFYRYPVLLAFEMNGQALTIRDKGPLWIVYPRDDFAELKVLDTDRKMIWQLIELDIR